MTVVKRMGFALGCYCGKERGYCVLWGKVNGVDIEELLSKYGIFLVFKKPWKSIFRKKGRGASKKRQSWNSIHKGLAS